MTNIKLYTKKWIRCEDIGLAGVPNLDACKYNGHEWLMLVRTLTLQKYDKRKGIVQITNRKVRMMLRPKNKESKLNKGRNDQNHSIMSMSMGRHGLWSHGRWKTRMEVNYQLNENGLVSTFLSTHIWTDSNMSARLWTLEFMCTSRCHRIGPDVRLQLYLQGFLVFKNAMIRSSVILVMAWVLYSPIVLIRILKPRRTLQCLSNISLLF